MLCRKYKSMRMIFLYLGLTSREMSRMSWHSGFFRVLLWAQKELLEQLFTLYDHLDEELKAELPLKRVWMVAAQEE